MKDPPKEDAHKNPKNPFKLDANLSQELKVKVIRFPRIAGVNTPPS